MLEPAIKNQLRSHLEKLQRPIELVASLDDSAESANLKNLLAEVAETTQRISVRLDGEYDRRPAFSVGVAGQAARIRFAGLPMGHEFTSLVLALLHTGGHPPRADAALLEQIRSLPGEYRFETYVSLSCHNCPDVVQALNLMAAINPRISHVMIDGQLFQDEVATRQVMAVPTVYLNGEPFGQGRQSLEEIVARLDTGAAREKAAALSARAPYDVLIVGGGPAGAAAAIYAARKGIRTGLVAEHFGGQVLDTLGIENFISVQETQGPRLVAALEAHVRQYEVDVISGERALALHDAAGIKAIDLSSGGQLRSRSIILATGARWREMNVPGEREYRGKGVAYCPHCDGPLFRGKRVAVIGGGNSGVEAAIDLAGIVAHVTLLEFAGELRADAILQKKLKTLPNVSVICNAQTTEVTGQEGKVNGLIYANRANGEAARIALDGVFVQIGLLPNTDWLKNTLNLTRFGEIEVDARGQTSQPGVFAAGDATTVPFKQIIIAMGDGAKAALSAFDHLIRTSAPS